MTNQRYVCVHGHFYQPPRENPWLDDVEEQPSARPYHDWNARVTDESYRPNAFAHLPGGESESERIVNNYAHISFNFGATLFSWLERYAGYVYDAILVADHESAERLSGHGNAIAQGYNHIILPLANQRDKRTQVIWGIRDFERRFGRLPEGMWLPETAADTASLETLAEQGIAFTILAPHQAQRVRALGAEEWTDVPDASVDPRRVYRVNLPSGRSIAVFFYNGPLSRSVAFEQLLQNGDEFAQRLLNGLGEGDGALLSHIATDGETYGHHQRLGEMALAYALERIESGDEASLTNYGEFLEKHPPQFEAQIIENTSWSCAHGIERWRSDCGCNTGGEAGWNQAWRKPLRDALDWLRDSLAERFESGTRNLLRDPWAARDDYIEVILDRSPRMAQAFLARHRSRRLRVPERIKALLLMEMQRQALLMYASCAWFFTDVSGIETQQVLAHACRAVQLAREATGDDLEAEFIGRLAAAKSNIPEEGDAARVYRRRIIPLRDRSSST